MLGIEPRLPPKIIPAGERDARGPKDSAKQTRDASAESVVFAGCSPDHRHTGIRVGGVRPDARTLPTSDASTDVLGYEKLSTARATRTAVDVLHDAEEPGKADSAWTADVDASGVTTDGHRFGVEEFRQRFCFRAAGCFGRKHRPGMDHLRAGTEYTFTRQTTTKRSRPVAPTVAYGVDH